MIRKTKHWKEVLDCLKDVVYKNIPNTMWDRDLWFYNKLTNALDIPFIEPKLRVNNLEFYIIEENSTPKGVLCKEQKEEETKYYIYCHEPSLIEDFFREQFEGEQKQIEISTVKESVMSYFNNNFPCNHERGWVRFYTDNPQTESSDQCMPIGSDEVKQYKEISHLEVPIEHLNYFGYLHEGKIVSTCGVAPKNNLRAEIIGVNTYNEKYRNKGFAKKVCASAMSATDNDFDIFTWTTQLDNQASIALAKSLGFKEYQSEYVFRIDR